MPNWAEPVKIDDFLVAVGKKQSNSVYHVAEIVSINKQREIRMTRFTVRVFKTDLLTALRREGNQNLIPIFWYKR